MHVKKAALFLSMFRYHTGSLAFGALIVSVVELIRIILEYLEQKLKGLSTFKTHTRTHTKSLTLSIIADIMTIMILLMFLHVGVDNSLSRFIMLCFKCCLWCLEKFIRYMNHNAYIMVRNG